MMYVQKSQNNSFNLILCILIITNIVGCFIVKDAWVSGSLKNDWTSKISLYLYGAVIIMMVPSFLRISSNTVITKFMVIYLILNLLYGYDYGNHIQFGLFSKKLLLFFSFIYFDIAVREKLISKTLLHLYILSMAFFAFYRVTQADVIGEIIESGVANTGQATSLSIVFLLPLVAYLWKPKYISYFYIFAMVVCLISMRRTSIIAGLLFFPFMLKYLKESISRRIALFILVLVAIVFYYLINKYWDILVLRFNDMFNPSEYNESYGSGRSIWFGILSDKFFNSGNLFVWLFGFGIDAAGDVLINLGYTFRAVHSDFLELLYDTGFVGIILFLWVILKHTYLAFKATTEFKSIVIVSLIIILFCGSVSSFMNNPTGLSIPLFLSLVLHSPSRLRSNTES